MKRNKNLGLWLSIIITVAIALLKIPISYKAGLLALFIIGLLYIRRGVFYYIKANKKITSTNTEDWADAWPLYRKAIKAGIQKSFVITAASMFLQRGDRDEGKAMLLDHLANSKGKDPTLDAVAKTMVSMAYWMEGDLKHALSLVEEVYENGPRDKNLYINYTTYLIEDGQLERAQELIDEAQTAGQTSPGTTDNQGWLHILHGRWDEAEELFSQLVERNPRFAEPYVHYAQILLHYGEVQHAIDELERAMECNFSNTSAMNKKTIDELLSRLKDPATRIKTAKEIDRDPKAVASGKLPAVLDEAFDPTEEPLLSGFTKRPKESEKPKKVKAQKVEVSAEREPNTDLTEEDLKLIEQMENS